jgi:CHAT domain-containing protein/tetratricopeptide (TPR) repeat protein
MGRTGYHRKEHGVSSRSRALRCFASALTAILLWPGFAGSAQVSVPRGIEDITALLDQYKPDPAAVEKLRATFNAQPPQTDDKLALIRYYDDRAWAADALGAGDRSIDAFRKARELARGMGGQIEAQMIQSLANQLTRDGNYLDSIKVREETLALTANMPGRRNTVNYGLVFLYSSLGDLESTRTALKRQEEGYRVIAGNAREQRWMRHFHDCFMHAGHALMLWLEAKYAEADAAYRESLASCDRDQAMAQQRVRYNETGEQSAAAHLEIAAGIYDHVERMYADYLTAMGRLNEAELVTRNSLRRLLSRAGRYNSKTGYLVVTFSKILLAQGRYAEAAAMARAAVDIFEKSGVVPESAILARARRTYAGTLVARARWTEALAEYDSMRRGLSADPRSLATLGIGDFDWGLALVATGKAAEAEKLVAPLVPRNAQIYGENHPETALVRGLRGMALARMGDHERALEEFSGAVKVLINGEIADTDRTPLHAQRVKVILDAYIGFLMDIRDSETGRRAGFDVAAEAFRLADVARGSNVQRAIVASAARASVPDSRLAALIRRQQDTERRIELLEDVVTRQFAAPPDQQLTKVVATVRAEIGELRADVAKMKREISDSFPDYANLINPKPATIEPLRATLRDGEVLLSVLTTTDRTNLWVVTNKGLAAHHTSRMGEQELARMVTSVRKALDPGDVPLDKFPDFDIAAAHRLYTDLLKPLENSWRGAHTLIVVANGALAQLPFGLLPTEPSTPGADGSVRFERYKQVPWLIRRVAVTQLPAASTLVTLRTLPPGNPNRTSFAGFGDPQFDPRMKESLLSTPTAQLRNLSIPRPSENKAATMEWMPYSKLASLPDTRDEILTVATALKADMQKDVFLGRDASKQNVRSAGLANRRIIAFATHGLIPGDFPNLDQPALALAAPDGNAETGLLTLEDILGLKLDADWILLSACNTAAGDGAGADAISGLGRGFFYAGSRALLVTHWPVETISARMLVTGIFERYTNDAKMTRAEALRQSMLSVLGASHIDPVTQKPAYSYAHPIFWAPYAIVGDGGTH